MPNKRYDAHIVLHWWNLGRRTLDFKGKVSEYLKEKNIRVRSVKHPTTKGIIGLRFKFELSSRYITLDIYHSSYEDACFEAIKIFLTILGDKATIAGNSKFIKVNH